MKTRLIDADKLVDSLRVSMNHGRETFPVDLIVEYIAVLEARAVMEGIVL